MKTRKFWSLGWRGGVEISQEPLAYEKVRSSGVSAGAEASLDPQMKFF